MATVAVTVRTKDSVSEKTARSKESKVAVTVRSRDSVSTVTAR